jgi:hypothetical protein
MMSMTGNEEPASDRERELAAGLARWREVVGGAPPPDLARRAEAFWAGRARSTRRAS